MFPHQRVPGLAMIEFAGRGLPLDDVEILAVVLGVTARAILAAAGVLDHLRVEAPFFRDPPANLHMATEAPKPRSARAKDVTGAALRRAA